MVSPILLADHLCNSPSSSNASSCSCTVQSSLTIDGWMFHLSSHKIYIEFPSLFQAYLDIHSLCNGLINVCWSLGIYLLISLNFRNIWFLTHISRFQFALRFGAINLPFNDVAIKLPGGIFVLFALGSKLCGKVWIELP